VRIAERDRPPRGGHDSSSLVLSIVSLGTGIPITAIAAGSGGVAGVVVAWWRDQPGADTSAASTSAIAASDSGPKSRAATFSSIWCTLRNPGMGIAAGLRAQIQARAP